MSAFIPDRIRFKLRILDSVPQPGSHPVKIALFGATGHIGGGILKEALRRGHDVVAIVRDPARLAVSDPKL
jgi:hypothetical protein